MGLALTPLQTYDMFILSSHGLGMQTIEKVIKHSYGHCKPKVPFSSPEWAEASIELEGFFCLFFSLVKVAGC